ncbi:hypothetical protein DEJ47_13170 [Streptomyces venezuelae]|uniref:Uncharacterized protein n=1 Tax=Streptomyces venezuelae TaxID=54571 RepID=A0A5P2BA38_STRVZ|nr:hypothetical protein DEJ47_13170 [Streptomyces venezuelae]
MVFAHVGELVAQFRQFLGVPAVPLGDARLLVAFAPVGRGFEELVQFAQGAVPVAEHRGGDRLKLRGGARLVELVGPRGDTVTGVGEGERLGERSRVVGSPAMEVVGGWPGFAWGRGTGPLRSR